ncbi:MAG: alpha/beta fold hydrolase [Candidatus Methanoplasma sp.]|jgi:alpha-beta hydrolase superfamily lysophospholipase|nr:alpha/beta fold hydrolase [Candidatus Methanoplasma sp.]
MNKTITAVTVLICCTLVAAAAAFILIDNNKSDPDVLPAGLREIDVKINADTRWELNGKLTTCADQPSEAAAILVHGSGPHGMDLTIGPNKVYRDIAWNLAKSGVDVLRYDKRTFVYGNSSADNIAKLTVKEEVIDDAVAAAELMKSYGYDKIFLIGHSLGGMLAPAIVKESDGLFDGFVSLAGSPRKMQEILADQILAAYPERMILVQIEFARMEQMGSWTESELLSNVVFGQPAYYVKDMNSRDAGAIALSLDVPMLFLQGSADFQVYPDKDFAKWQEVLEGKEGVEFKLYDGLNHLFMVSQGKDAGTVAEYNVKGHVDQNVIEDIAEFIKAP